MIKAEELKHPQKEKFGNVWGLDTKNIQFGTIFYIGHIYVMFYILHKIW